MVGSVNIITILGMVTLFDQSSARGSSDIMIKLRAQLTDLVDDNLGVKAMQNHFDKDVTYVVEDFDAAAVMDRLLGRTNRIMSESEQAVIRLQRVIQQDLDHFTTSQLGAQAPSCVQASCDLSSVDEISDRFSMMVNLSSACMHGPGYYNAEADEKLYLTDAVLDRMIDNMAESRTLNWQYFGTETGVSTLYPQFCAHDKNYDPRFRPWYSQTASPIPKDVVLVLDRSGSMGELHDNRTLLDIEKLAASTLVDTLNPNDRVAIVFYGTYADTPPGNCYSTQLAVATPRNKLIIKQEIKDPGWTAKGETFYSGAFTAAFRYFHNDVKFSTERVRVILFLTDGLPTKDDYIVSENVIREENAKLNNSVIILTYGLGKDIPVEAQNILRDIAQQKNHNPEYGEPKKGMYIHIDDPDTLRYQMAHYYGYFSNPHPDQSVTISVPYVDAFGQGMMISMCLPIHTETNNTSKFRGVTCIDVTLAEIFEDVTHFSKNHISYGFVVDREGRVINHPLLALPTPDQDGPVIVDILDLETAPEMVDIRASMTRGEDGNTQFISQRVLPLGDHIRDGIRVVNVDSLIIWKSIGDTGLTLCIVYEVDDRMVQIQADNDLKLSVLPIHRLDLWPTRPETCAYLGHTASTDHSVVKFAMFAFVSQIYYTKYAVNQQDIRNMEAIFNGKKNSEMFKEGIRETLLATKIFDEILNKSDNAWRHCSFRYFGTENGIFWIYPGVEIPKMYDHTTQKWYLSAMTRKSILVINRPSWDLFSSRIVLTLSQAIYHGKNSGEHSPDDRAVGVMAMDIRPAYLMQLVEQLIPSCHSDECYVLDDSGYIVVHPRQIDIPIQQFHTMNDMHIIADDSDVAQILIDNGVMVYESCVNFVHVREERYWRITGPVDTETLSLDSVPDTNVYILHKKNISSTAYKSNSCPCSRISINQSSSLPECIKAAGSCECPCTSNKKIAYDMCNSVFNFTSYGLGMDTSRTPCTPALPVSSPDNGIESHLSISSQQCFPIIETCRSLKRFCWTVPGCQLCPDSSCQIDTEECKSPNKDETMTIIYGVIPTVVIIAVISLVITCKLRNSPPPIRSTPTSLGDVVFTVPQPPIDTSNIRTQNETGTQTPNLPDPVQGHLDVFTDSRVFPVSDIGRNIYSEADPDSPVSSRVQNPVPPTPLSMQDETLIMGAPSNVRIPREHDGIITRPSVGVQTENFELTNQRFLIYNRQLSKPQELQVSSLKPNTFPDALRFVSGSTSSNEENIPGIPSNKFAAGQRSPNSQQQTMMEYPNQQPQDEAFLNVENDELSLLYAN